MLQNVLQNELKKSSKHIPYTYQRNGIYYFRYRVPKVIQQATNLPPILRQSLKTKSPIEAKKQARISVDLFFNLQEIIMAKKRHSAITQGLISFSSSLGEFRFEGSSLEEESKAVSEFVDKNSGRLGAVSLKTRKEQASETLPQVCDMWERWQQTWGDLTDKESKARVRYMDILLHLFGKHPVDITAKQADEVMRVVDAMPKSNINPYCKWSQAERVEAAVKGIIPEGHRVSSAKHALKVYQGFYRWLKTEHIIDTSPFNDRRYQIKKGGVRGAFNIEQVQRILDFSVKCKDPNKKWMPLVMAYTGMRNGELQRLTKSDIRCCKATMVWYIQVTDSKTVASSRRVPIAQALLDLGFLAFIESLDEGKIFSVSDKWLTRYYSGILKKNCMLPAEDLQGAKLSVYSFRHTVTSLIRSTGVNVAISTAIMGHSSEGGTHAGYTHVELLCLQKLKQVIDSIPYRPKLGD